MLVESGAGGGRSLDTYTHASRAREVVFIHPPFNKDHARNADTALYCSIKLITEIL